MSENANDKKYKINRATLVTLEKEFSNGMLNKMAHSGIHLNLLKESYEQNGQEAILLLFTENVLGKPRVTKNKKILDKLKMLYPTK